MFMYLLVFEPWLSFLFFPSLRLPFVLESMIFPVHRVVPARFWMALSCAADAYSLPVFKPVLVLAEFVSSSMFWFV